MRTTTYFHVTSPQNRASIESNGLDWQLMEAVPGVAGGASPIISPEAKGIFLCDGWDEAKHFAEMAIDGAHAAVDVWEVSLPDGAELVTFDNGYEYFAEPIPRSAIRLVKSDWSPESRFAS